MLRWPLAEGKAVGDWLKEKPAINCFSFGQRSTANGHRQMTNGKQ
jgi:hypothetical protein